MLDLFMLQIEFVRCICIMCIYFFLWTLLDDSLNSWVETITHALLLNAFLNSFQ